MDNLRYYGDGMVFQASSSLHGGGVGGGHPGPTFWGFASSSVDLESCPVRVRILCQGVEAAELVAVAEEVTVLVRFVFSLRP